MTGPLVPDIPYVDDPLMDALAKIRQLIGYGEVTLPAKSVGNRRVPQLRRPARLLITVHEYFYQVDLESGTATSYAVSRATANGAAEQRIKPDV